jgi:predicted transcriptional regulator
MDQIITEQSPSDNLDKNETELNPKFDDNIFNRDISPEAIASHIEDLNKNISTKDSLFLVRSAAQCIEDAKKRPIPRMLFGEFWYEGEICILFADTNLGKSILAVQIANSISSGTPIHKFKLESSPQKVLYFDFELSDKQFEARYSNDFSSHFIFDPHFLRAEINPDISAPEVSNSSSEDFLYRSLEDVIINTGARILIVDNITYLRRETEHAKEALPLMKYLKSIKAKYNLSILALAHTPKRDLAKPITRNDLQGSKMLINFCDSAFAIGESTQDGQTRYLKQIKARNTEIIYDTENVCTCQISKPDNFLKLGFLKYDTEREHLKQISDTDRDEKISEAKKLNSQGFSNVEIAKQFGVSEGAIRKWFKKTDTKDENK